VGLVYDPRGLSGVMTARPGVAGVLEMVLEPTFMVSQRVYGSVEKDTVAYESGTWVHKYDMWVLSEGHDMVRMLLTGHTIRVCQSWTYEHGEEGTFLAWG
jgi:hypothetical protein